MIKTKNYYRTIRLNNVRTLYDEEKYDELVRVLEESLINSTEIKNSDNSILDITTQFEVLLESLWNLEKFEECLKWSERCLKYSCDIFLTIAIGSYRQKEWADIINYILTYIQQLIFMESYEIILCLDKYLSRLVQYLIKILSHQLDLPFDKNNNIAHPINIKMPWIILQQILQYDEDMEIPNKKKRRFHLSNGGDDEDEGSIPNSIMIFFTSHEFLGIRSWCTNDNGELLLYILDIIVPRLRAPYLEQYRDIISEHLEQITYCLYGYPAKRARLRHIEEHDSTNIQLTWKRSIQLFDIYRPDKLPEFNSYK